MKTWSRLFASSICCILYSLTVNAQQSGQYGYLSIVIKDGKVYGDLQYYSKWNVTTKEFDENCVFYLYGVLSKKVQKNSADTINVNIGYISDKTKGTLIFAADGSITLKYSGNFVCGYEFVDFTKDGYSGKLEKKTEQYIGIGVVKDAKSFLYNSPNDTSKTKGYIVLGDFFNILEKRGTWAKIEYQAPNPLVKKPIVRWIKLSSIYDEDPAKWQL